MTFGRQRVVGSSKLIGPHQCVQLAQDWARIGENGLSRVTQLVRGDDHVYFGKFIPQAFVYWVALLPLKVMAKVKDAGDNVQGSIVCKTKKFSMADVGL